MVDATENAGTRAAELGVDLEAVEGTGQDGRVTAPDVEAFAKARQEAEQSSVEQAQEEQAPEPPEIADQIVVLNPDTGLGGYAFDQKFEAVAGARYALTEAQYKHYSKVKHNGLQVLVKA